MLKELREAGKIDKSTYRKVYKLIKGGMFRSRAHLKLYLEQYGLLKEK
jgi:large subunit ribosomal protein L19e